MTKAPCDLTSTHLFNPGENIAWNRVVRMFRDQTRGAEQSGFTTVWCTEHHFAQNGYLNAPPKPVLMCSDLGAYFDKIRLGQAPLVLPDWHPLRVAEDIALPDNMTEGRLDFGAGRGTNERTCIQFNLDADKRNNKRNTALFQKGLDRGSFQLPERLLRVPGARLERNQSDVLSL